MGCSFYINLLIAHELFRLLSATKRLESYTPPSTRVVLLRCLGVALPCAVIASLGAWAFLPHEARLTRGLVCMTTASGATTGTIGRRSPIHLTIIFPLLAFIPTVLTLSLAAVSWRRELLDFELKRQWDASKSEDLHARAAHRHRVQQAQMLTNHFVRILVVVLLWYPALVCTITTVRSPTPTAIGVPFVFIQSLVSAAMALTKPDIKDAAVDLFRRLACRSAVKVSPLTLRSPINW
jgi:hypothetical protein